MSQLLVVQGADSAAVQRAFGRLVSVFESLSGARPIDQLLSPHTAVAKFPRLRKPDTCIARAPSPPGHWLCAAGTPFWRGSTAPQALAGLAARWDPARPDSFVAELTELEGPFVLAAGTGTEDRSACIVTDRLGTLHAYTAEIDSCAVVSTSSLLLAAALRPEWHPDSCREFLATGTVFGERSLFRGIRKLGPAQVFALDNGRLRAHCRYWDLARVMAAPATRNPVPAIADSLESALDAISSNFPNPLLDLTGGYDSRAVLGAMLKLQRRFSTVVVGPVGDPDVEAAGRIAQAMSLPHLRLESEPEDLESAARVLPLCDGEVDLFEYGQIEQVHTRLAGEYDASVNGSNGEIAKGYWWEVLFPYIGWRDHFDPQKVAAARFSAGGEVPGLLSVRFERSLREHFADLIAEAGRGFERHPNTAKMDNVYLTLRMQHWQGRLASATSRIWPCLSPFMWRRPMELILSTPPSVRISHRLCRRLIEQLNPTLAAFPLAQGYPALPLRLTTAHRFLPLVGEIAGKVARRVLPLRTSRGSEAEPSPVWNPEAAYDLLRPAAMLTRGLYDEGKLAQIVADSHNPTLLRRILTLELLARKT